MKLSEHLDRLQSSGYVCFTRKEAEKQLGVSKKAINQALWRYKKQGKIIEPVRGFYVIVPVEYYQFGSIPPEHFISDLMKYLNLPYYVCLLSAAQLYNAAHQKPQIFQVMTNQKRRPIFCGKRKVEFVYRKNIYDIPLKEFKTPRGYYTASTPEATAIDLIAYPERAAGLNNVLTILVELAESIRPKELGRLINKIGDVAKIQRLGYLFELVGQKKLCGVLSEYLNKQKRVKISVFAPKALCQNATLNKKWNLLINIKLEPDI